VGHHHVISHILDWFCYQILALKDQFVIILRGETPDFPGASPQKKAGTTTTFDPKGTFEELRQLANVIMI